MKFSNSRETVIAKRKRSKSIATKESWIASSLPLLAMTISSPLLLRLPLLRGFFFFAAFFGTFFPSALASERPMAIALLAARDFLARAPLFKVPPCVPSSRARPWRMPLGNIFVP